MRTLIIGNKGQIGQSLKEFLSDRKTISIGRKDLDLDKPETVQAVLKQYSPSIILNAAAYTQVEQAEENADTTSRINYESVFEMAQYAKKNNALLVQYSTDYVFDGSKQVPYVETDSVNPLSIYGQSKRDCENAIQSTGCLHFIFRTSWVYSVHGKNFPNAILNLARKQDKLRVVSDQFGAPTYAGTIASVTATCVKYFKNSCVDERKTMVGLYHLTNSGQTSWFGLAKYLLKGIEDRGISMMCNSKNIEAISSASYSSSAFRPNNSSLNCSKICKKFDLLLENWTTPLDGFLDSWVERNRYET